MISVLLEKRALNGNLFTSLKSTNLRGGQIDRALFEDLVYYYKCFTKLLFGTVTYVGTQQY